MRHVRECAEQLYNICKEIGVKLNKEHWDEHIPKSVETSIEGQVTILWNLQGQTDRTSLTVQRTS
jgi:hypothetical protein